MTQRSRLRRVTPLPVEKYLRVLAWVIGGCHVELLAQAAP